MKASCSIHFHQIFLHSPIYSQWRNSTFMVWCYPAMKAPPLTIIALSTTTLKFGSGSKLIFWGKLFITGLFCNKSVKPDVNTNQKQCVWWPDHRTNNLFHIFLHSCKDILTNAVNLKNPLLFFSDLFFSICLSSAIYCAVFNNNIELEYWYIQHQHESRQWCDQSQALSWCTLLDLQSSLPEIDVWRRNTQEWSMGSFDLSVCITYSNYPTAQNG